MANTETQPRLIRFEEFELDIRAGELRKHRVKLKLTGQPLLVLAALVERPGDLITRDELQKRIWPDTFVDVDHNLNTAINKIREALGDSAESPIYIETIPRRGYRFIGELKPPEQEPVVPDPAPLPGTGVPREGVDYHRTPADEAQRRARRRRMLLAALAASAVLIAGLVLWYKVTHPSAAQAKLTHIASNLSCGVQWSPDGRAIAYAKDVNGTEQLFVRYLNSPVDIQLTREPHQVFVQGWLTDGTHILFFEAADATESDQWKLFSVAAVGGEPELIMPWTGNQIATSPDGKRLAIFTRGDRGEFGVQVSDPVGSPLKWYLPDPFKTKTFLGPPGLDFMPDGKALLLTYDDEKIRFRPWLLPYPAGTRPPQPSPLTLPKTPTFQWSWMPDHRHIVASWAEEEGTPPHLWMWDTASQERIQLTTGVNEDSLPRVSPDGSKLVYAQFIPRADLTELSLVDGSATPLISTGRQEIMASWSSESGKLTWVSNQNAPAEIWVREPDGTRHPVVSNVDFPPGTNKFFMNPAISPDGDRIIYEKPDPSGTPRLWISSLRGGVPVHLTNAQDSGLEWGGSWSPDGQRFVYSKTRADKAALMIVKTTGDATPAEIGDSGGWNQIPSWSPTGDWIALQKPDGWHLISPDGKSTKFLGKFATEHFAFSKDGKLLYGIQEGTKADPHALVLFSLDLLRLKVRNIKHLDPKFAPYSPLGPGIRFSLSPDGKRIVYSTSSGQSDLWLMDGLPQPSWVSRLRDSFM